MPKSPTTRLQKVEQFNKSLRVKEILGDGYRLPVAFHASFEEVFDDIKSNGKSPANGGYTRVARWIKLGVPCELWKSYNSNILNNSIPGSKGKPITKDSFIWSYGEKIGSEKWNSYCMKQSVTNTADYKKKVYNWSEKDFIEYNKSRAVTLKNQIKKYGLLEGTRRYNEYVQRQRYSVTLEYFVERYGEEEGTKKFNNFSELRATSNLDNIRSNIEIVAMRTINEHIDVPVSSRHVVLRGSSGRHCIPDAMIDDNIIIEFNGDYWHRNPKSYNDANDIWIKDKEKYNVYLELGYRLFVIWEGDWYKDQNSVIDEIKNFINSNLPYYSTNGEEFIDGCRYFSNSLLI